jgi:hypothetical protein
MQLAWTFAGTAGQPFHCWDRLYQRYEETRVVYLGARDLSHQWKPTLIDQQMVFASEFAAIGWVSARVLASGRCWYACSVNACPIPHYLVVLSEPSKNRLVDALPNAGSHPFVKATPACHATAAAEFARQVLPWYSSLENKQDSGQGRAIIDARAAAFRRWAMGRKMSGYKGPQVFGKKCTGHGISSSTNTDAMLVP